MISTALQVLKGQAERATQGLAQARLQITQSFDNDYVVGTHAMEQLIAAQHSVRVWAQVGHILDAEKSEEQQVARLRVWVQDMTARLLETGRSSSTSLVANAITLSEEDEQKRVLQLVNQFLDHVDSAR